MNNPHDFSSVELIPESQNQPAPTPRLEWRAIGLGLAVGLLWWLGQTLFWRFFYLFIGANYGTAVFRNQWFLWFMMAINFAVPLAYGTVVGFVVGYRARYRPYLIASIVMILLFFLSLFITFAMYGAMRSYMFSLSYLMTSLRGNGLALIAALNGVYLAQSVKRNRGVQIQ